jgi:RNA polymerase sigma-70 factor, ECF subfamily
LSSAARSEPGGTSTSVGPGLIDEHGAGGVGTRAVSQLFYEHARRVHGYVRHHHPGVDADDIVSDTFVIAMRRLAEITPGSEAAWLIGVARNVVRNTTRSARRRQQFVEALINARPQTSSDLGDGDLLSENVESLRTGFARLTQADQEVLLLAAWEGLAGRDLAIVLGTSAERATDRLYRARRRLREHVRVSNDTDTDTDSEEA